MPSLKALKEFKSKFALVGGEDRANIAQNTPFDDLSLPDHEPAPLPEQTGAPDDASTESLDAVGISDMQANDVFGVEDLPMDDMQGLSLDGFDSDPSGPGSADSLPGGAPADDDMFGFGGFGDLVGGNVHSDIPQPADPSFDDVFQMPDDELPSGDVPFDDNLSSDANQPWDEAALNAGTEGLGDLTGAGDDLSGLGDLSGLSDMSQGTDDAFSMTETPADSESPVSDGFSAGLPESFDLGDAGGIPFDAEPETGDAGLGLDSMPDIGEDFNLNLDDAGGDSSPAPVIENVDLNMGDIPEFPGPSDEPGGDFSLDDTSFGSDFGTEDAGLGLSETDGQFDSFPDFPGEDAAQFDSAPGTDDFNLDTGDMSGFPAGTDTDFPADENLGDMGFGDDAGFGGMEDLNPPDTDGSSFSDGEDSFPIPDESFTVDDISSGADSFDNFDLDKDVLSADLDFNVNRDAVSNEISKDLAGLEDFNIQGLDDAGFAAALPQDEHDGLGDHEFDDIHAGESHVEEIRLSDSEFDKLQETVLSYPLNLRIACEQIIAEEVVSPELLSSFVKLLVKGAPAKETASLASKILGKTVSVPKGYEKKTGEEFEAEQASFSYIFVHKFLPVFRLYMAIALLILSLGYLAYTFLYIPNKAERIYEQGYERIAAGEYNWANRRFQEAFQIQPKTEWFYRYAEAFRDERQYIEAERKYQELMYYTASKSKRSIPDKQAVLDYAALATYYMKDYEKADALIRRNILDYLLYDKDALLALGDNNLAWGEIEPDRLEDAREAYATLMERYGRSDPVLERMLRYFIMTDSLREVLPLQNYFMYSERRAISAPTLAELGGYLMDKRTQEVRGVPNEYLDSIGGIREVLIRAIRTDVMLPEPYYHLARYYNYMGNQNDEGLTLERSIQAFNLAKEETPRRLEYHIDALRRYAEILIRRREFFPAEEQLIRGVALYENGISRRVISRTPEFGKLYANLGDLEYFVKSGDMNAALDYYSRAERSGYSPSEMRYRMGVAHYQLEQWPQALNRFLDASEDIPFNRRILYALGNASYFRGNYYAAQAYYDRLLDLLNIDRSRFPAIMPTDNKEQLELAERLMVAQNNMGVVLDALTERTGDNRYRSRAMGLFTESERAWDIITRNPDTMIRMRPSSEIFGPGVNPAYLNIQNNLRPVPDYEPQFFLRIDRDMLEPSGWEDLVPPAFRLSQGLESGLDS